MLRIESKTWGVDLLRAPVTVTKPEYSSTMKMTCVNPPGEGWGRMLGSNEMTWPGWSAGADVDGG